jgi:AbrB family looped-hinge helix DNA binding protein
MTTKKFSARIISGYRITIPEEIRDLLLLSEGDILDIEISKAYREDKMINEKVDKFELIKNGIRIEDERSRHCVAGVVFANSEEMDIGV